MIKALRIADRRGVVLGVAIMALSAVFIFFHTVFYEDVGDDIIYKYILTPPYYFANYFGAEKVTSLTDAIKSQCSEWHVDNGRFVIHTITQMFVSVWGRDVFAICSALVALAIEMMLWVFVMKRNKRYPIIWAVIISILFAFYAEPVVRLVAFSMNYIWPVIFVLPCIYVIKRVARGEKVSAAGAVGCVLLALLTGCTQEVFAVPLSCASFVLLCYMLKKRRKVSPLLVCICVALWIGTATVVLAPGTMNRGDKLSLLFYWKASIIDWIDYASVMPVVWLMVLACICVTVRYGGRAMMRLCPFEMTCLLFAMVLSIFAHTLIRSLSGFRLFCLIVFLACMARLLKESVIENHSRLLNAVSILVFLIFSGLQIMQVSEDYRYCTQNRAIVEAYMESPDGIVEFTPMEPQYKMRSYYDDFGAIRYMPFLNEQLQNAYGSLERPILLLTHDEIERFSEIGTNDSLRVPGNAGFYYLTDAILVKPVDSEEKFEPFVTKFKKGPTGIPLVLKLLAAMRKSDGDGTEIVTTVVSKNDASHYKPIHTRYGDYIALFLEYKPVSVNKQ